MELFGRSGLQCLNGFVFINLKIKFMTKNWNPVGVIDADNLNAYNAEKPESTRST